MIATTKTGKPTLVTPQGNLYFMAGVNTMTDKDAAEIKQNWVVDSVNFLHMYGFTSIGTWSKHDLYSDLDDRPSYTLLLSVLASFAKQKNITSMGTGHITYKNNIMPIFESDFGQFAQTYLSQNFARYANDPYLIGYYFDNELPFDDKHLLDKYCQQPATSAAYRAAAQWLKDQQNGDINDKNRTAFLHYLVGKSSIRSLITQYQIPIAKLCTMRSDLSTRIIYY
jgi:hypothetical protein